MVIRSIGARKGEYRDSPDFEVIELSWEEMRKRRLRVQTNHGRPVDLALSEGSQLHHGDLLYGDDQTYIRIHMAPEKVFSIHPRSPQDFGVICHEIGNRHLPAWISNDEILVLYDPVLKEFLFRLGVIFMEASRVMEEPGFMAVGGGISHHHHIEEAQ